MKIFTLVLSICFTITLGAQTNLQSATTLVNEYATASINNDFDYSADATVEELALEEVENFFNVRFSSNPFFGDINIIYDLATSSDVKVEVSRGGQVVFSSSKQAGAGTHETIWDENISEGSGIHEIKIIANNKVESIRITL